VADELDFADFERADFRVSPGNLDAESVGALTPEPFEFKQFAVAAEQIPPPPQ
jgi:hypothetical protein